MKIQINKAKTASIDVDAQKGFTPLCPTELPVPGGDEIVSELNKMATFAKYRIGSKDWHHPDADHIATPEAPQFTPVGSKNIDIKWNRHCVAGTRGAELLDGLPDPQDYDFFVYKGLEKSVHVYGICYHDLADKQSTGLIEWLKDRGVETVLIGGLATDFCVLTSIKQLARAGFDVILVKSATRAINAPTESGKTTLDIAMDTLLDMRIDVIDNLDSLEVVN